MSFVENAFNLEVNLSLNCNFKRSLNKHYNDIQGITNINYLNNFWLYVFIEIKIY